MVSLGQNGRLVIPAPFRRALREFIVSLFLDQFLTIGPEGLIHRESGLHLLPCPHPHEPLLEAGDELVLSLDEGQLRISTREQAIARAQEGVRQRVRGDVSLVDELIKERRVEARKE